MSTDFLLGRRRGGAVKAAGEGTDVQSVLRTLVSLARGALPAVAVATVVPLALFYLAMLAGSVAAAIALSMLYAYAVAAYQYWRHRRLPGMLTVAAVMATVRAATALASGQVFLYFALPAVETAAFGLMFAATMFSSEPLVVRLARDLVPHAADGIAGHAGLTKSLSLIWTATYLGSCATTLVLLATAPMRVFVGAHTLAGWLWTGSGMALTIVTCQRKAAGLLSGGSAPVRAQA